MIRHSFPLRTMRGAVLLALACTSMPSPHAAAQAAQDTTTSYQYDAVGNLTQITSPLGHVTKQSYDALNRLSKITDPNNGIIQYLYDGLDQLASVTDPRGLMTTYTVNGVGNRTALTSPDTGSSASTFDAAGNPVSTTDAKGQVTQYQYDILNRIARIAYADGSQIDYSYDQGSNGLGRLTQIVEPGSTTQYAYDQRGRLLTETRTMSGASHVAAYAYDNIGRLVSMTYPSGRIVTYSRDSLGRIHQIATTKDGITQAVVSQVHYRPFGPVQSITFGNGQSYSRSYDLDGRTTGYTLNNQPQMLSYDAASRITAISDAGNSANNASYGYDLLDRLTSHLSPNTSHSYGYDAAGNRTSQTNSAAVTTYAYAANSNRLTQISGSQAAMVSTDVNGSIVDNGVNQFHYDARGRMISANTALGPVQYRINALGQRVQKITPTETTLYHYDMRGNLIGESTPQGAVQKEYLYLDEIPVAAFQ